MSNYPAGVTDADFMHEEAWAREQCGTCAMYREYPHEVRTLAHDGLCLLAGEVMQCERSSRACEMWEPRCGC